MTGKGEILVKIQALQTYQGDLEDVTRQLSVVLDELATILADSEIVRSGRAPQTIEFLTLGEVTTFTGLLGFTLSGLTARLQGGAYGT